MERLFYSDKEIALKDEIRDFLSKKLAPIQDEINQKKEIPISLIKEMGKMGFFGPLIPEEYNGTNLGMIAHCIITEEISKLNVAASVTRTPCILDGYTLINYGTVAQKEKYLKKIVTGDKLCSICITEERAGSDAASIQSIAKKDGAGYILNGSKRFITNAGLADYYLVWCVTNKKVDPRQGISVFLVEKDTPGFTIEAPYGLLGLNGVKNGILNFDNVRIPQDNLVGEEGKGFQILMSTFNVERITLSSECNGISLAALEASKNYAKTRIQFGKPIASFQGIRFKVADMATKLRAARLLTYSAAKLADLNLKFTKEASMAKAFSSKTAVEIALEAVQIHGGDGYTDQYPVERYLRDAKFFQIGGGTSEIQNLIIAREELKES
ncbi:MAG: acyl-CoA dehydrogenase family protein [Candidatus Helarchaeota archaeon]|nr:acyl-CoA dehydrogenase family protein [Candidatus Helarchaeota archaeon]